MNELLSNNLGRFRIISFVEGMSYLILLFVAMPLKYFWGKPEMVKIVGMAHGVLFVLYVFLLIIVFVEKKWSVTLAAKVFISSLVPFGALIADKWIKQS